MSTAARDLDGWPTGTGLYRRWTIGPALAARVSVAWMIGNTATSEHAQNDFLRRASLCAKLFPALQVHIEGYRGALICDIRERSCPTP